MSTMRLRPMELRDRAEVAELICVSTNVWYQLRGRQRTFPLGPESTTVFFDVYESLDPGCGVVAENPHNGRLMGSCFYHPREHHISLGIMNVHPNYFGRGVARALLQYILDYADKGGYPAVRLVQSAMNLDSFSLYTRAGFVPRCAYQDMVFHVPEEGLAKAEDADCIRAATLDDISVMAELEREVSGICRQKDYRYFIENRDGIWGALVYQGPQGIEGFMSWSKNAAFNMVGPGVMRSESQAASLIRTALDRYRSTASVFLVPVECRTLVEQMYALGARNCELHFCQVRGQFQPFHGISMPVFLPESA